MSHLPPPVPWIMAASLVASMAGAAVAIFAGIHAARRANRVRPPGFTLPQYPPSPFVAAALSAAMAGAMIYMAVSAAFPPAYVGAAVFLVGFGIALRWGLRRPRA